MYESPISIIQKDLQFQFEQQLENEIYKAVQEYEIVVDKEELIKALSYDRNQYEKGHIDGYNKALDDFVNACKEDILCQTLGWRKIDIEKDCRTVKGR